MSYDIKSFLINQISSLSESIRQIENESSDSGIDFKEDKRYIYLIGKRDFAKFILNSL